VLLAIRNERDGERRTFKELCGAKFRIAEIRGYEDNVGARG
jgi:hypothetical protein